MGAEPGVLVLVRVSETLPPDGAVTLSVPPSFTDDTPGEDIVKCAVGGVSALVVLNGMIDPITVP